MNSYHEPEDYSWDCSKCQQYQDEDSPYTLGAYGDTYCESCAKDMTFCSRCGSPEPHGDMKKELYPDWNGGPCVECGWEKWQDHKGRKQQVHEHNRRLMGGQSS